MLSMPSFIGLVMLIGVSTKNSILLVEYAIMAQREHGLSRFDALIDACHARPPHHHDHHCHGDLSMLRSGRPGHADNSLRAPMAAAVIGGLITPILLSLLVTPSFFSIVDDIEHFVRVMQTKLGWPDPAGQCRQAGRRGVNLEGGVMSIMAGLSHPPYDLPCLCPGTKLNPAPWPLAAPGRTRATKIAKPNPLDCLL